MVRSQYIPPPPEVPAAQEAPPSPSPAIAAPPKWHAPAMIVWRVTVTVLLAYIAYRV